MANNGDFIIANGVLVEYLGLGGDVAVPDGVRKIGACVFRDLKTLTSVTLPHSVTAIGKMAFKGCDSLVSVTVPGSLTDIGFAAFEDCPGFVEFVVGKGNSACSQVRGCLYSRDQTELIQCPTGWKGDFVIPDGVTRIRDEAFWGCEGLTSVTIPETVTAIGKYAFASCVRLKSIFVSASNPAFCDIDGVLYDRRMSSLIACPGAREGDYAIPKGVTKILEGAFWGCGGLTGMTIPRGVNAIGERVFCGCGGLVRVTIPQGVNEIGALAFAQCHALRYVAVPQGVTSIDMWAFADCDSLKRVTIPDGIEHIDSTAFYDCRLMVSEEIYDDQVSVFQFEPHVEFVVEQRS